MATVSFFCTRCRRLTTFPASRRGAIVYCPRCQQALIVPDIPMAGDGGEEEKIERNGQNRRYDAGETIAYYRETGKNSGATANGESWEEGGDLGAPTRRMGATIASHLTPGKKRPENWRRVEISESSGELDNASLITRTEVSDAEFFRRLRPEAAPQVVGEPPVAPPVLWGANSETREDADAWKIPKLIWGAVAVAALGSAVVVGAFCLKNAKNSGNDDVNDANRQIANATVFVDGLLTYRTANGTSAPDDGAFVFLFPNEERLGAPIALGDVSPQRPTPPGFENVVAELEARGGRFAIADFEGRFAFENLESGEYRVLLVSRCVGDDLGKANPAVLKEIERCVVGPRLLLERSRFFWTTRRFDRDAATLEKSFGKAGAPFSNVE